MRPLDFESDLARSFEEGKREHGDLGLALPDFEAKLRATVARLRARGDDRTERELLSSLAVRDLYLAGACCQGSNDAWRRFQDLHSSYLLGVARQHMRDRALAQEIADSLLGELVVPRKPAGHTLLSTFDGSGSLRAWLRMVLFSRINRSYRERSAKSESVSADAIESERDNRPEPSVVAEDRDLAQRVTGVLSTVFKALDTTDLLLLRLYHQDSLTMHEIGSVLNKSESTVSRRLDRVRSDLEDSLRDTLGELFADCKGNASEVLAQLERTIGIGLSDIWR